MARIYAFDLLKTWSIFLVVVGHVFFFSFHETDNFLWQFIDVVNMPMFMFISGFFSGKASVEGLVKRLRTLLLPTFTVGFLYSSVKGIGIDSLITSSYHNGYWFCFTLFCLYFFYLICEKIANTVSYCCEKSDKTLILLSGGVASVIGYYRLYVGDSSIADALSLPQFCRYSPYFVYGIVVHRFLKLKDLLMHSNLLFTFSLIGIVIGMYIGGGYTVCRWIIAFSYIHVMMYVSTNWYAQYSNKWVDYVATRTIDIYLYHYFLLPSFFVMIPEGFNPDSNIM